MCKRAIKETDFLGYYMTPTGVTPMQNKIINTVLKIGALTNNLIVRLFVGTVMFYKSTWPCQLHIS